jgi:hypothetical protein
MGAEAPAPRRLCAHGCRPIGLRFFSKAGIYEHRKSDEIGRGDRQKKGRTQKQMVPGTVGATVEATVESQFSKMVSEGDL